MKKLKSLDAPFKTGHSVKGQGNGAKSPEGGCLPPFKGTRAGAMRKGNNRIMIGYPDAPMGANGHPGAHQA